MVFSQLEGPIDASERACRSAGKIVSWAGVLAHMDLAAMLVELPLQGFHRRCRVPGQPRPGNRKVCVAAGALAMQPRFVVFGDLLGKLACRSRIGSIPMALKGIKWNFVFGANNGRSIDWKIHSVAVHARSVKHGFR
jgi:hypothetical protein